MLDIARAISFIWLGPYRGKMMRAGNFLGANLGAYNVIFTSTLVT